MEQQKLCTSLSSTSGSPLPHKPHSHYQVTVATAGLVTMMMWQQDAPCSTALPTLSSWRLQPHDSFIYPFIQSITTWALATYQALWRVWGMEKETEVITESQVLPSRACPAGKTFSPSTNVL